MFLRNLVGRTRYFGRVLSLIGTRIGLFFALAITRIRDDSATIPGIVVIGEVRGILSPRFILVDL